jgi:hypothetical protein
MDCASEEQEKPITKEEASLHNLRKEIDVLITKVGTLKTQEGFKVAGRETALSYTHLQEAKMWLGQALGMVGSVLPPQFADKV